MLNRYRNCAIHLRSWVLFATLIGVFFAAIPPHAAAEGSIDLTREDQGARANLEWRTSSYGDIMRRRTLLKVYAQAGEYILLGSSAVAVPDLAGGGRGDIRVYAPGLVQGPIGEAVLPAAPTYSCLDQRLQTGNAGQGRISSRDQERSGPRTIDNLLKAMPGSANPTGYVPCFYRAAQTGIHDVVFFGPAGDGKDSDTKPTGAIADNPANFSSAQDTSVAAWDVTIRPNLQTLEERRGRLFAYYLTLYTGDNARPVNSVVQAVTLDGFRYTIDLRGMDPNGFVLYGNQVGFLNTDGTPLYHDVMADRADLFQEQNQLFNPQGGVRLERPAYPIFFGTPDDATLTAIGIPLDSVLPQIRNFGFVGSGGGGLTTPGDGGTFAFTSNVGGVYEIVLSRDGHDFDPAAPQNRVLRGVRVAGGQTSAPWDGRDNRGELFPAGNSYVARTTIHGGEFHFPFLDVENSVTGSPMIQLTNPPDANGDGARTDADCPSLVGGCFSAVYDDRGYRTASGALVGTGINAPLCANNVGMPPEPLMSGLGGYDSRTTQRRYGFSSDGNPNRVCDVDGGFGDKKGLDLWSYYPSNTLETPFQIVAPTAVELASLTATRSAQAVTVRWETRAEASTRGFHVLRSTAGRAQAEQVTPALIPALGANGGVYNWVDASAPPSVQVRYWLREVAFDGSTSEYGPATAAALQSGAAQQRWLPLIGR